MNHSIYTFLQVLCTKLSKQSLQVLQQQQQWQQQYWQQQQWVQNWLACLSYELNRYNTHTKKSQPFQQNTQFKTHPGKLLPKLNGNSKTELQDQPLKTPNLSYTPTGQPSALKTYTKKIKTSWIRISVITEIDLEKTKIDIRNHRKQYRESEESVSGITENDIGNQGNRYQVSQKLISQKKITEKGIRSLLRNLENEICF